MRPSRSESPEICGRDIDQTNIANHFKLLTYARPCLCPSSVGVCDHKDDASAWCTAVSSADDIVG